MGKGAVEDDGFGQYVGNPYQASFTRNAAYYQQDEYRCRWPFECLTSGIKGMQAACLWVLIHTELMYGVLTLYDHGSSLQFMRPSDV